MEISSVVFDYGSVLAWPPSSESCTHLSTAAEIPKSVLLDRYFTERAAYDRDTIDAVEYWRNITSGYPAANDESILRKLAELDARMWSDPNESILGWLPELKAAGLTLAILSNMPDSFCATLEERDRWLDTFDHRIFSGRVKCSKPEPEMYQLLLDTLSSPAGPRRAAEVLFIDDLQENVEGARAAGINAELYNVFDAGLSAIAARYGLPPARDIRPPDSRLRDFACAPHRQGQ